MKTVDQFIEKNQEKNQEISHEKNNEKHLESSNIILQLTEQICEEEETILETKFSQDKEPQKVRVVETKSQMNQKLRINSSLKSLKSNQSQSKAERNGRNQMSSLLTARKLKQKAKQYAEGNASRKTLENTLSQQLLPLIKPNEGSENFRSPMYSRQKETTHQSPGQSKRGSIDSMQLLPKLTEIFTGIQSPPPDSEPFKH